MIYGHDKSTLIPYWPELGRIAVSLGPLYTCAWYALERSTWLNAPVCSDPAVARRLIALLGDIGVIATRTSPSGAVRRSLYDPLSWTYRNDWPMCGDLATALSDILENWSCTLDSRAKRWLWLQLADGEVLGYLNNLLRRHCIDPRLAEHILDSQGYEWGRLSLGRKRYVLWSSSRGAASELLRTDGNEATSVATMVREMHSKAKWLVARESSGRLHRTDFCFLPGSQWRLPITTDAALEKILKIGSSYWLDFPSSSL